MMELSEFNNSFERKIIALLGDLNANLIHYDLDRDVSDFLDLMYSNTLLPQITTPSRITSKSGTLIDNILVNVYDPTFLSRNLTVSLSDLAQFLITSLVKKKNELANNRSKVQRDMNSIDLNKDSNSPPH